MTSHRSGDQGPGDRCVEVSDFEGRKIPMLKEILGLSDRDQTVESRPLQIIRVTVRVPKNPSPYGRTRGDVHVRTRIEESEVVRRSQRQEGDVK